MRDREELIYLQNSKIDYQKWDRSITRATNSRIYAVSWYLDRAAESWDALIWGDYQYIMPLPHKRSFGIKYLYQPRLCQQLGIFPAPPVEIAKEFYNRVFKLFKLADLQLNASTLAPPRHDLIKYQKRKNYLLPLFTGYESLKGHYSQNTKRNIKKALNNRLFIAENISIQQYIDFIKKHDPVPMGRDNFRKFSNLVSYLLFRGFGQLMGVYTADNRLCAAALFCRWRARIIYLNPASSERGREYGAMFLLFDHIISKNAASNVTIDFEGSMIPGIERFFSGFGATPEIYYHMQINRLPTILQVLKRFKR